MPSWRSSEWGIPNPNGCAICDAPQRIHAQIWDERKGWHSWAEPTDAMRLERMKHRRQARLQAG